MGGAQRGAARRPGRGGPAGRRWPPTGRRSARDPFPAARPARGSTALSERDSLAIARAAGIPATEAIPVPDAATAVTVARRIGRPVVLKLDADGLSHKTELGGVALGLQGDDAVYGAALNLFETARRRGIAIRGLLVEPMAAPGTELIVGLRRDPQFGPAVLVGLGGILAEFLDDVAIRLAPLDAATAEAMLDDLRGASLLGGVRGRLPADRAAVARILVALGDLGIARPDILEVDLNPVIVSAAGAIAVDALVVAGGPRAMTDPPPPSPSS